MSITAQVQELFTHPVKGLTPQKCDRVFLQAGHGIKGDRAFALMYEAIATDIPSTAVPWMKKKNFAMQCDVPKLAALNCHYDEDTAVLTIKRQEAELLSAATDTSQGRDRISEFFSTYIAADYPKRGSLRLVGDGANSRYPDREPVHISLVSQATLDDISAVVGQIVDARRFRPNVVLQGLPAWAEFDWVGKQFQLGETQIAIAAPINRCLNIDVNPDTGDRDIPLFALLKQHFSHQQTGVLAQVLSSGTVSVTDRLKLV